MGQFYYAAKAFDVLERLDPNPEYWEGKRGACVGIFQQIIAGHEPRRVEDKATHRQFCVLFKYIPCRKFFRQLNLVIFKGRYFATLIFTILSKPSLFMTFFFMSLNVQDFAKKCK